MLQIHNNSCYSYVIMNRTTIVLPEDVKDQAMKVAHAKGISFGSLVWEALSKFLSEPSADATQRARQREINTLLRFSEDAPSGPPDLSERLDDYLYGNAKEHRKP